MATDHHYLELSVYVIATIVDRIDPKIHGDKIVSLVELVALLQKLRYGDDKALSINLSDLKYIANNTSLKHILCQYGFEFQASKSGNWYASV